MHGDLSASSLLSSGDVPTFGDVVQSADEDLPALSFVMCLLKLSGVYKACTVSKKILVIVDTVFINEIFVFARFVFMTQFVDDRSPG